MLSQELQKLVAEAAGSDGAVRVVVAMHLGADDPFEGLNAVKALAEPEGFQTVAGDVVCWVRRSRLAKLAEIEDVKTVNRMKGRR